MVPILTWGLVLSYFPRAARTVKECRRCETAACCGGVLRKRVVEDLEMKEEDKKKLEEGFGGVCVEDAAVV